MRATTIFIFLLVSLPVSLSAQTGFDLSNYQTFLAEHANLTTEQVLADFGPQQDFYKGNTVDPAPAEHDFLDEIIAAYDLTEAELALLEENYFMVSERLSHPDFGNALRDIFVKDLPVFITTDMILHALHCSYDAILMNTESCVLYPQLESVLAALYESYPSLEASYAGVPEMSASLDDVDLYITVARRLLTGEPVAPRRIDPTDVDVMMNYIDAEMMRPVTLFMETTRDIDFSQFKVRGHYTETERLRRYFKSMMWLGRMEFWLTMPETYPPPTFEDLRRMTIDAVLIDELIDRSGARSVLESIDLFITLLVGESDNLTPPELAEALDIQDIDDPRMLLNDGIFFEFQALLSSTVNYGQRILSSILIMDPFRPGETTLPVSFKLLGQRFIVDSYVLGQVVFPNILFHNNRVWRGLPDPLDAAYAIGNNTALPLLQGELDRYLYGSQLAGLRYLIDAYDEAFWDASLYNSWLQGIRRLNPTEDVSGRPFFMLTAAWQQAKLNTQLASWAQLRHDNLLYAKQSYTGGASCSYPHGYVEPYPEFYCQLARFAQNASALYAGFPEISGTRHFCRYFDYLEEVMTKLELLAGKELNEESFSAEENTWLQTVLYLQQECGPPYNGWFIRLFYVQEQMVEEDYIVADIHTQPTDELGNPVGKVLHVGIGKVNLGVFLANAPSADYTPMAYVGPVLSYYEKVTTGFHRMTDEEWTIQVHGGATPARPDWANIYMASCAGTGLPDGRELPSSVYDLGAGILIPDPPDPVEPDRLVWGLRGIHPNPFQTGTAIAYTLDRTCVVKLEIWDATGRRVITLVDETQGPGEQAVLWDAQGAASGRYYCRLRAGSRTATREMILVR